MLRVHRTQIENHLLGLLKIAILGLFQVESVLDVHNEGIWSAFDPLTVL